MGKEKRVEQLTCQFQQDGTVNLELLHSLCRTIDIQKQLPFSQDKADDFFTVLFAIFEKADRVKQAQYLNTMLTVRDCAGELAVGTKEQIESAFTRVCAC